MHPLNKLFTLSSLSVVLVSIERYSFTTDILLQPSNFLRLHELVQMTILILLTVVIPFFLLREITNKFEYMKTRKGQYILLAFIVGVYFYATGNGLHEVSSFNFNTYCSPESFRGNLCEGFYINDYYTGNILYFMGGVFMVVALLIAEKLNPSNTFRKKDMKLMVANALIYSLAIFAYAAFDEVLVGLVYSVIITLIAGWLFLRIRRNYLHYPVITYTVITYGVGTIGAFLVRFF